ncbi:MAG: hypothetical protein A2V98_05165 [Planctomycetes bacterium RBG_16_64_12]|nr:MAG: hypothetical protein A2V98_05165 [Planctomycetes bacterium RBG_16_64_12]
MLAKVAICAAALLAADTTNEAPKKAEIELISIERNVILHTNAERKRHRLPPLEVDPDLVKSARSHCSWMTRRRTLQHTGRAVAENIAMGQRSSKDVVEDWMGSSGHRANILNRSYRRIGVAAYRTESGTIFWCQQFLR